MIEPKASRPHWPDAVQDPSKDLSALKPWDWALERLEKSHNYWISTTRPDGRLISCLFGESGGGTPFGSARARALAKPEISSAIRTLLSAPKKRTKPSSSKVPPKKSRIVPSGSNSLKSTTANTEATSSLFSWPPMAASSASLRNSPSVRMNTPRTSPTLSPAGTSNPSGFLARPSGFWRRAPHLLPLAVGLTMQHQRQPGQQFFLLQSWGSLPTLESTPSSAHRSKTPAVSIFACNCQVSFIKRFICFTPRVLPQSVHSDPQPFRKIEVASLFDARRSALLSP